MSPKEGFLLHNPIKKHDITISQYEIDLFKKNEKRTVWLYKNETNQQVNPQMVFGQFKFAK